MSTRSSGTTGGDQTFAQRLSPLIAASGVVAVPSLLIRHQARLQLSNAEVVYLLHVLSHRWDADHWPWVAVSAIADSAGVHSGVVRRWKASLEAKGYLICRARVVPGVGRRADEHDLSQLFGALESLAIEEESQKAIDQIRSNLPDAQYHPGLANTPQLPAGRPGKKVRARPHENVRARPGENAGALGTKTLGRAPAKTPGEVEAIEKETISRTPMDSGDDVNLTERNVRDVPTPTIASLAVTPPGRGRRLFPASDNAEELLLALYRGLGSDPSALTPKVYRRELEVARALAAAGATPLEAETYARETNVSGRRAAVDMSSFEHDRASWRSRHQRVAAPQLLKVVNGRIPE